MFLLTFILFYGLAYCFFSVDLKRIFFIFLTYVVYDGLHQVSNNCIKIYQNQILYDHLKFITTFKTFSRLTNVPFQDK